MSMTKGFALVLVLVCLMALGTVCNRPVKAEYQSNITNITINADGSVTPSTASIQQAGNIYTLTSDLDGAIEVDRSNTILNGNGHTIVAAQVYGVLNITLENFVIKGGEAFGQEYNGVFAGISLSYASNVTVANNTITGVWNFVLYIVNMDTIAGIVVEGGHSETISGNNLVNNWEGMIFSGTSYNLIVGNNITSSRTAQTGYSEPGGIYFDRSSNNTIYHNNFEINIGGQAKDSYYDSVNIWDDGYPFGGNYWSDYQKIYPNATEIDNSGIANKPYIIDELDAALANNTDRYPLMAPFNSTFYALQITPPKISIVSPLNQTYNDSSVPLTFSVDVLSPDKSVNWTGYSLDRKPNVTITSNRPITNVTMANMTIGMHNITVYANDTYGNIAVSQTINFMVEKPQLFPIATVTAVSGTVAVVVVAGLLVYFKKRKSRK